MSNSIGDLNVFVGVDDKKLDKGLKSAEKDIKKFDKNTKKEIKSNGKAWGEWGDDVGDSLKGVGGIAMTTAKMTAGAFATGAVAFLAFAESVAASERELATLARQSGMTVDEFRAMSFAVKTVGVDSDQLSGQLEDTRRKLAEFGAIGTGAFQDYADVMKLNKQEAQQLATELSKLSGKDAVLTLTENMEKAGVSGTAMAHVLDSLGSDMDRLLPLLRDGGREINSLSDNFNKLSISIEEEDLKSFQSLSESMDILTQNFKTFFTEALSPLAPMFEDATTAAAAFFKSLTEQSREADKVAAAQEKINNLLGEKQKVDRRGRKIGKDNSDSEANQINDLILLNEELTEKIRRKERTTGRASGAANKWLKENKQSTLDLIEANESQIESLSKENEAASEVLKTYQSIGIAKGEAQAGEEGTTTPEPVAIAEEAKASPVGMLKDETDRFIAALRDRLGQTHATLEEGYKKELEMLQTAIINGSITEEEAATRKAELLKEQQANNLALITEGEILKTQTLAELETARYQGELARLEQAEKDKVDIGVSYDKLKEKLKISHDKKMNKLSDKENKDKIAGTKNALNNVATLMNTGNKTLFNIGKAAALANAAISAQESVVHAYNAGSKLGGPLLGGAFAAAAGVAQAVNMAGIASQSFGGGGSAPTSYQGGVPTVNTSTPEQAQIQAPTVTEERVVRLDLAGTGLGEESMRDFIEQFNDAIGDGVTVTGLS